MHAGVDLREMVQGLTGALGNIDGFFVAEQSLNEAFDFLHARTAQALEIVGIRLDRQPCQPERLRSRLPSTVGPVRGAMGAGIGSSPALTRAMISAARRRAWSAEITPWRPTVTRFGPPGPPGPRVCAT